MLYLQVGVGEVLRLKNLGQQSGVGLANGAFWIGHQADQVGWVDGVRSHGGPKEFVHDGRHSLDKIRQIVVQCPENHGVLQTLPIRDDVVDIHTWNRINILGLKIEVLTKSWFFTARVCFIIFLRKIGDQRPKVNVLIKRLSVWARIVDFLAPRHVYDQKTNYKGGSSYFSSCCCLLKSSLIRLKLDCNLDAFVWWKNANKKLAFLTPRSRLRTKSGKIIVVWTREESFSEIGGCRDVTIHKKKRDCATNALYWDFL